MVTNKYKDNPLEHLEAWLYESLNSDAIPSDVYDVLVNVIREQVKYHEEGLDKAKSLLALVQGEDRKVPVVAGVEDVTNSPSDWQDFWEGKTPDSEFEEKLGKYGYEYTPLTNDQINATSSYNDGWTQQYHQSKIPSRY